MKVTLLKQLLAALNEYNTRSEKITQPIFLNGLFDLDISSKVAGDVILLKNTLELRRSMRAKCEDLEFEKQIRKVVVDIWNFKNIIFVDALKNLVETTPFLTQSEKRELLQNKSFEYIVRRLLYIGLGNRKLLFEQHDVEQQVFRGRRSDISRIRDILYDEQNEQKICYLRGVNGIGKTSLAKYMGFNDEFADYVKLQYDKDLQKSLMECNNFPEEMIYEDRLEQLKIIDDNLLLIVDNVNESYKSEGDHFSKFIASLPCYKILIFNYNPQEALEQQYQLPVLSENDLLEVFKDNNHIGDIGSREKKEIINVVHNNTFLVKLCAKLLEEGAITTAELLKELKSNLFNVTDETTFQLNPYEKEETYNRFIADRLYNMVGMDMGEKQLLFAMWLFREYGIDKKVFLRLMKQTEANRLNVLIKKGWIERAELDRISIHKIIADCIGNERKKDMEQAKKVDDSIYEHAEDLIKNPENEQVLLSYKWIYVFAELLIQSERKDREYADFLILMTRVCIGNFPSRETVELFLPKLKECDKNMRTQFYIQHFENLMGIWERNFSELRQSENGIINSLIPYILNAQNVKEWMDYFDCLASGFELIRSSYSEEIKISKDSDAIWENMMEDYNYEHRIMEALIARRNDLHSYKRVHSYLANFALYSLKYFIDDGIDVHAYLDFLSSYIEWYPDISIEVHRAKARLALKNNDYEEAKKEAQLAYEESCKIDNQSYELECLEDKIVIYKLCGVSDDELLEDRQKMEILVEATRDIVSSRYYLPK